MEVLPDFIVELLDSYDDNCGLVERKASEMITSINIPMFGALRDLRPSSLYLGLNRLQQWFGKKRNMEHCLCLIMLTDYVSCAYNSRDFYCTFHSALTRQFIDGIFEKLFIKWQLMLESTKFSELPCSKIDIVQRILTVTCKRYSDKFRHKNSLRTLAEMSPKYFRFSIEIERYLNSNRDSMLTDDDYSSYDENDNLKIDASQFFGRPKTLTKKNTYDEQSTIVEQSMVEKRKVTDSKMVPSKIPKLDTSLESVMMLLQGIDTTQGQSIVEKRKVTDSKTVPSKVPKLDTSFDGTKKLLTQQKVPRPSINNSMHNQTVIAKPYDVRKCGIAEPKFDAKSITVKKNSMQENLSAPRSVVNNPISQQMKIREPLRAQNTATIVPQTIKIDDDVPPLRKQNTVKIETITIDDDSPKKENSCKKKLNAFDILMRRPARVLSQEVCH